MKKLLLILALCFSLSVPCLAAQRAVLQDGDGAELGTSANPLYVDISATGSDLVMENAETIGNDTDGEVDITCDSGDANCIFTVTSLNTSNGNASIKLQADASADSGDDWVIKSEGSNNGFYLQNDTSGSLQNYFYLTPTGTLTLTGGFIGGVQALTTSSADPGVGVANLTTLVTQVTTDDTGASADTVSLAAGAAGQIKIVTLAADTEAAGLSLTADYQGATAAILFEDVDDSCVLISDGSEWTILVNNGGTTS